MWIGSRGGGKTYSCAQLLKAYEKHGIYEAKTGVKCIQRIIIMSPTVDANPVWTALTNLDPDNDVYGQYSDAQLVRVINEIGREAKETDTYLRRCKAWDRACKARHPHEIRKRDIETLMETQFQNPREVSPKPRYTSPVVNFLVLDDLVGSSAFKAVGQSALTQVLLKNRHYRVNVAILAQSMKSVPRTIRMNESLFVLFKFANAKVVLDLYEEVSSLVTESEFEEIYRYATADDHGSLVIDMTQPDKAMRFKKGWNEVIVYGNRGNTNSLNDIQPRYKHDHPRVS
jgi:hypothetical protein